MNYGFIIDNRKCIGCHACTVACKSEHDVPIGVNRTWVKYIEKGSYPSTRRVFSVMRCNHCENAPCVEICPVGALFNREDGIVDFNNKRCIGCKSCMQACPYDSIFIDPNTNTAAKCNYCAHRIDMGLRPACVNICPEEAIVMGDLDDEQSEISKLMSRQTVQARKVEKGTVPKLFYINGDAASLNPMAAPPTNEYQQSLQAAGVGHYAKYAEKRLSNADPKEMARILAGKEGAHHDEDPKKYGVTIANGGNMPYDKMIPTGVTKQKVKRTQDVPQKGIMWGWEVPAYLTTKAISAGAVFLTFLAGLFDMASVDTTLVAASAGIGLLFLGLTAMFLIMDLDQPMRFFYVMLRPQFSSWLAKGGLIIGAYGALVTAYLAGYILGVDFLMEVGIWGGMITSVPLAIYTAFLLAQAKGRDFWQSPVLPFHMMVHSSAAGAAVMLLLANVIAPDNSWMEYLVSALKYSLFINLAIVAIELTMPHPTLDAKAVVRMITSGVFAGNFYGGTLLIGNILPLALLMTGIMDPMTAGTIASVATLVGIYITEKIWVTAPQMVPLS